MALPEGVVANATYARRVPELPTIIVDTNSRVPLVRPDPDMTFAIGLSPAQVQYILGDQPIGIPTEGYPNWTYDMRHQAQRVLRHIYLGPYTAARDLRFLTEARITMLLVIRDTRMAMAQLLDMRQVANTYGLALHNIDVTDLSQLIRVLPTAVKAINDHVLKAPCNKDGESLGRVLVLCETGNGRSAAVVVAYVMAMYRVSLEEALAFVNRHRYSMCLDEDSKNMLKAYADLVAAQNDVARQEHTHCDSTNGQPTALPPNLPQQAARPKRRFTETQEMDKSSSPGAAAMGDDDDQCLDTDRFQNRLPFAPFTDAEKAWNS